MSDPKKHINIVAIGGSVRSGNFTAKALAIAVDEIRKHKDIDIEVIDPAKILLPLPGQSSDPSVESFKNTVANATGVILATPEYHGSFSSVTKLIIENLGYPSVMAGKPVGLIGVASGRIGAIKALEHLSSVCMHIGLIVLPGPASVAGIHKIFDKDGQCLDKVAEDRIRSVADNLIKYIRKHICPKMALEEIVRQGT